MRLLTDFAVEASAALVGVFAAVLLALWVERRRVLSEQTSIIAQRQTRLGEVRDLILLSIVKNTSEAKRVVGLLKEGNDPYLFDVSFERAVWEAAHEEFIQLAPLDERVIFARFFDHTRRLSGLLDFHRQTRAQYELSQTPMDTGDRGLFSGIADRLKAIAEDLRLDGIVIVTDHGKPMHQRLLGLAAKKPDA